MDKDTDEVLEALQGMVKNTFDWLTDVNLTHNAMGAEEQHAVDVLVKYGYAVKVSHEPLRYKLIKGDLCRIKQAPVEIWVFKRENGTVTIVNPGDTFATTGTLHKFIEVID